MSTIHPQFGKAAKAAAEAAIEEVKLFCKIMCYPDNDIHLVGEDPHGVVSIGDDFYNMTDIHVVISEYDHWISIYGSDSILRKVIWQWYDWRTDWHNKHPKMEWADATKDLPKVNDVVLLSEEKGHPVFAWYCDTKSSKDEWHYKKNGYIVVLSNNKQRYWLKPTRPDNTHDINLRSWLMGYPVEGLREATHAYKEQQEQGIQEAHERTIQAKAELDKIADEYNEQTNKGY